LYSDFLKGTAVVQCIYDCCTYH